MLTNSIPFWMVDWEKQLRQKKTRGLLKSLGVRCCSCLLKFLTVCSCLGDSSCLKYLLFMLILFRSTFHLLVDPTMTTETEPVLCVRIPLSWYWLKNIEKHWKTDLKAKSNASKCKHVRHLEENIQIQGHLALKTRLFKVAPNGLTSGPPHIEAEFFVSGSWPSRRFGTTENWSGSACTMGRQTIPMIHQGRGGADLKRQSLDLSGCNHVTHQHGSCKMI